MKSKNSMLSGSSVKTIISFALPIMLSSFFQYNYALVDNIIVGRYVSTDALAAVGNTGPINSFIIGAALGLTSGFTIPVAHAIGEGNKEKASRYAGSSIVCAFFIGIIISVFGHLLSTPLLRLIGTPENIIDLSAAYVNILYYAVPLQMLSNNFTAISRAIGESKKPLYFYTVSVFVNFALDILFVKVFKWGVEGAAIATLISHFTTCTLTGLYITRWNKEIEIRKRHLKPDFGIIFKQVKLGIPVSLQFTITSIGSMSMQSAINSFGSDVMAGFTAAGRVENLTNLPMSALGVATQTFVGQNYGAKQYERVINAVRKIFILDVSVSVLMSITLYLIAPTFVSWFMTEPNEAMLQAADRYILATCQCYSMVAILFVLRNTLQGLGFTYANTIAGAGEFIGRLSVAFIFTKIFGFTAACYAAPAAWLMADIPLIIIYLIKERKFRKELRLESRKAKSEALT